MIDGTQIKAARALLGIGQRQLAEMSSVHVATITRIEASTEIRGAAETVWKIQLALEKAGVEFIAADMEKGRGVRLRQPSDRGI